MDLTGKRVVITGATGGIGQAIARALDNQGCQLLLAGRDSEKLQTLLGKLKGQNHASIKADLKTDEGVRNLAEKADDFGAEVLINALGVNQLALLEQQDMAEIQRQLATNLQAPIAICQALLPILKRVDQAMIVNVGSIFGSIGYPGSALYCATKFGLRGFTEALRRELADSKVQVLYFAPRATATELNSDAVNEMNRELGNATDAPERVATQLVELMKKARSSSQYLGWPEKLFVRINGLFPSLVDNAVRKQLNTIKKYCSS